MDVKNRLIEEFRTVRQASVKMCAPLTEAQLWIQVKDHASPAGWNLVHTSWMIAQILRKHGGEFTDYDEKVGEFANSYYAALGPRIAQGERGQEWMSVEEIYSYRTSVDDRTMRFISSCPGDIPQLFMADLTLALEHERQHQELFYGEEKERRFMLPDTYFLPYDTISATRSVRTYSSWSGLFGGECVKIGNLEGGFGWDNEGSTHTRYLEPYRISTRLVSCGEYAKFIRDGGYDNELLWLSNGWQACKREGWSAPMYWYEKGGEWWLHTLCGPKPLDPNEPLCHVSFYEADAFAAWLAKQGGDFADCRLPTEFEWEHAARKSSAMARSKGFLENHRLHPSSGCIEELGDMFGEVWQWTSSHYEPYPRYMRYSGFLAEYNGKFMDNLRVLRGGSCVSERSHLRPSYRNFWPPATRWQFTGMRLAKDV